METFYNGLNAHTRMVVDASANGAILAKSYNEAYEILERISNNNYQWPTTRASIGRKVAGIHEVEALTSLAAEVSSMSNMLKTISMGMGPQMGQLAEVSCVYCGDGHAYENCPSNPASVCFVGNQNRNNLYSNSYNPGWRQHPNFSWTGPGAGPSNFVMPNRPTYPPRYSHQNTQLRPPQAIQPNSLETLMREYMAKNDALIQSQAASLRNLENQVGQLANELRTRPHGALPSDTENPKRDGKEHCKAIALKNGKELEMPMSKPKQVAEPSSIQSSAENKEETEISSLPKPISAQNTTAFLPQQNSPEMQKLRQQPPFPQRLQKKQQDKQFQKFLDVLKQLHINIPLVEALEQMPNYVKFMKDILTKKRRMGEFEIVALTKE